MSSPPRQARRLSRAPSETPGESRRRSTSRSALPLPKTGLRASRMAATQPTYDFLSGASAAPSPAIKPLGQSMRQSQNFRSSNAEPTVENEDFRAKIKALQYEVESLKQERDYSILQHEKAVRNATLKAEDDCRKAQAEENGRVIPIRKYDELNSKFKDAQDQVLNAQTANDKELRKIKEERRAAQDETEEVRTDLASLERVYKHTMQEVESKQVTFERTIDDLKKSLNSTTNNFEATKDRLTKKEAEVGSLESENLQLKAQTGDANTLAVVKRELSEQVAHIIKLEMTNRDQNNQLKTFRQKQKAIEVVQEEKRTLEVRLGVLEDVRKELGEAQLQRQILEDEKEGWTSYLQNQGDISVEDKFETPEDMARALVRQRLENASLMERSGALQSEFMEKDEIIRASEEEKSKLHAEIEGFKANGPAKPPSSRTQKALERQRALATKEAEYLREQLRTFDNEEQTYHSEENKFDSAKTKRITDLEEQLDDHRKELAKLTSELSSFEENANQQTSLKSPLKRPFSSDNEDGSNERLGQLTRKNRKLQDEFTTLQSTYNLLQTEHLAIKSQLTSLQKSSKTRVLSLRQNPTADFEAIKLSTNWTLKQENKDLLAKLEDRYDSNANGDGKGIGQEGNSRLIPLSTLEASKLQIQELEKQLASEKKLDMRRRQVWGAKWQELGQAVSSLLGWRLQIRPNGKVALSLHKAYRDEGAEEAMGGEGGDGEVEETIIFDGDKGIMKVAGGMDSPFAREIMDFRAEWMEKKGYIPGLMASVLLRKVEDGSVVL
ncbi:uncharacterized protein KY384_007121 [Bacidia gigantensis]|uniref:uncharacterized protein n=1 Tax=Bacidia gigantensis TaxID=2732470 RepID=UPI001D039FBB|nr:uncharacterized protein KY384_007121 [Bacidia gigantensis]KAG8528204.1 hypothetical protein KY384_007121 [Bacidia gigantensis]